LPAESDPSRPQSPPQAGERTQSEPCTEGLRVLQFLDRWEEVTGGKHGFLDRAIVIEEDPLLFDPEGYVRFYGRLIDYAHRESQRAFVQGTARKDTGQIVRLSAFAAPSGPTFTEEKLSLLRPFFEAIVEVLDPTLTARDRSALLDELALVPDDVHALREILTSGERPAATRNEIEYRVEWWGAEEGGTVELQASVGPSADQRIEPEHGYGSFEVDDRTFPGLHFPLPLDSEGRASETSNFGYRYLEPDGRYQECLGADLRAVEGTPVYATGAGTVTVADDDPDGTTGRWIEIDHGKGWFTRYQRLQSLKVSVGAVVAQGEQIGRAGGSGFGGDRHYPPHLRFEIRHLEKA